MNRLIIKSTLEKSSHDISECADEKTNNIFNILFNLIEALVEENDILKGKVQKLTDEVNRFKNEQGKPKFNKQKKNDDGNNDNYSSENERNKRNTPKLKNKKKGNIKVDRQVSCVVNKEDLPDDLEFKGYEFTVVQDIKIITDNVEFKREIYYSPSLRKTFIGSLPPGYHGEFGPGIRSLVLSLYNDSGMTEPALERFFITFGIQISKATISRMLTDKHDFFHKEKEDVVNAGIRSTKYQHFDDTGSRVNGKNYHTHILCNPYYTAYFTTHKKDRLSVLGVLCREELKFSINQESYNLMSELGLSDKRLVELKHICSDGIVTRNEIDNILKKLFPNQKKQNTSRRIILESAAIVYYKESGNAIEYLVCDDAPQFNKITKHKALCWVHEGRHYKKLNPIVPKNKNIIETFLDEFWVFYKKLLDYKDAPSAHFAKLLSEEFDVIFSTKTGYDVLDERIAKTLKKKESLLLALGFPSLPLHNNDAELGVRVQARKRDINFQTKNEKGTRAKDTFATIVQTAKKLSVNIFDYIYDRVSEKLEMPSLAKLIIQNTEKAIDSS